MVKAYRDGLCGRVGAWDELQKVSHREYTEGFMFGEEDREILHSAGYVRSAQLLAVVLESDGEYVKCEQRNKFFYGDGLDILTPEGNFLIENCEIFDESREKLECVPHAQQVFYLKCGLELPENSFVRSKK